MPYPVGLVAHFDARSDGDGGHNAAGLVANRSADAANARFQFFLVVGPAELFDAVDFHDELFGCADRVLRARCQSRAADVGAHFFGGHIAQKELAAACAVQGSHGADAARQTNARAGSINVLNVHDRVVAADREVDRLTGALEQKLHHADRFLANIKSIAHEAAVFKESQPQAPTAVVHAIDEAVLAEIPQKTVHGRHVNFGHLGNFMQTDRRRAIGKCAQDAACSLEHLHLLNFVLGGGFRNFSVV